MGGDGKPAIASEMAGALIGNAKAGRRKTLPKGGKLEFGVGRQAIESALLLEENIPGSKDVGNVGVKNRSDWTPIELFQKCIATIDLDIQNLIRKIVGCQGL